MENKIFRVTIIIILVLNLFFMARFLGLIYFPGEITEIDRVRQEAAAVYQYIETFAEEKDLKENPQLARRLADLYYRIDDIDEPEKLREKVFNVLAEIKESYYLERQQDEINLLLAEIKQMELSKEGFISFIHIDGEVDLNDRQNLLSTNKKAELEQIISEMSFLFSGEIAISDGRASWVPMADFFADLQESRQKQQQLTEELQELKQLAGFAPVEGSGIIVEIYDQEGRLEESGLVHDSDLKNIINEIKVAGAKGIEIGGQRLTATSPIRCVGSSILVNNKPVAVNPVTIKAVGDPEVLASGLDIIKKHFESFGLKLEITTEENISISGVEEITQR